MFGSVEGVNAEQASAKEAQPTTRSMRTKDHKPTTDTSKVDTVVG